MSHKQHLESMDTILTFDNRDNQSEWSVEWSTTYIPNMDNAAGTSRRRRERGRRRLRAATLAVGSCLTMHCRVVGPALTTGLMYYLFLAGAVVTLANPLRHFEVYLGQWSISGPGRAFRILPMLDGIGIAMCINSIIRAINCCTVAAITMLYVVHGSSDSKLPFNHCRDWNFEEYDPIKRNITISAFNTMFARRRGSSMDTIKMLKRSEDRTICSSTVGLNHRAWRERLVHNEKGTITHVELTCNELYHGEYPSLYSPPAYNYFYVELVRLHPTMDFSTFNVPLLICLSCIWGFLWLLMIIERITYGRLVWNNLFMWITFVPWIWVIFLAAVAIRAVSAPARMLKQVFKLGHNDFFSGVSDAFVIALYIHSASTGTELIHGKGLNYYASGHIDPLLNYDNVWHSGLVLALTVLHSVSGTVCALADVARPDVASVYNSRESILWVIPMYSQCTSLGNYSHAVTCIIFGGLSFSYIVVAYSLIKTALHTIFEYKVKLVFVEQQLVGALVCSCMLLSVPYATNGGLALLESVDSLMTGLAMPLVCVVELVALVFVYRSSDFKSDLHIATEENTCNTRISTSWHLIPFVAVVMLVGKIISVSKAELPARAMGAGAAPLLATALAVPLRALHNAIVFLRPAPRRGV